MSICSDSASKSSSSFLLSPTLEKTPSGIPNLDSLIGLGYKMEQEKSKCNFKIHLRGRGKGVKQGNSEFIVGL